MGFDFVETMLSDGKGGDCLWANVFQLSAFCFFAWKPKASAQSALSYLRHHEDVACRQPISATTGNYYRLGILPMRPHSRRESQRSLRE